MVCVDSFVVFFDLPSVSGRPKSILYVYKFITFRYFRVANTWFEATQKIVPY